MPTEGPPLLGEVVPTFADRGVYLFVVSWGEGGISRNAKTR
jgi:hypothetical protein